MDDIGLLALEVPRDLYDKLKHDFNVLTKNQNSYAYFNFIITANHLIEWIKRDDSVSGQFTQKAKEIQGTKQYQLINDMANRGKHFIRRKNIRKNPVSKDKYTPRFGYNAFNYHRFNYGGPDFIVEYQGERVNLYNECKTLFNLYKVLFEEGA